jgi:hypothetical protein
VKIVPRGTILFSASWVIRELRLERVFVRFRRFFDAFGRPFSLIS